MFLDDDDIQRVLAGQASYDALNERAQALVRAEWDRGIAECLRTLDFTPELQATGLPWAEADANGRVFVREPGRDSGG